MTRAIPLAPADEIKSLRRIVREQRKALVRLTDIVLLSVHDIDEAIGPRKDVPEHIGQWLARFANRLSEENDKVRYFTLGVDFRADRHKTKAVRKAQKRLGLRP
jgi:hypothetical protein